MENTKFEKLMNEYTKKACEFLNNSPIAKTIVDEMTENAVKQNFSKEQWQKAKVIFVTDIVLKMILDHEDLKKEVCEALVNDLELV